MVLHVFATVVCMYVCTYIHEKSNTPFSYMLCLLCKKAYRELSLERALDVNTYRSFSFLSSSASLG